MKTQEYLCQKFKDHTTLREPPHKNCPKQNGRDESDGRRRVSAPAHVRRVKDASKVQSQGKTQNQKGSEVDDSQERRYEREKKTVKVRREKGSLLALQRSYARAYTSAVRTTSAE